MLSKHPGRCRYPHGHSRRVDIVLSSEELDAQDMVCDFKAVRLAVEGFLDRFDHAMLVNSDDPAAAQLRDLSLGKRVIELDGVDPTTEVMARHIFEYVQEGIGAGKTWRDADGNAFTLSSGITLERVRVTETSSSWAEYGV